MTDFIPSSDVGGGESSPVTTFDPHTDAAPPFPGAAQDGSAPIVLLLDSASDVRWAAESAVALATAWSRGGRRIIVADLHLEDPLLHEVVGSTNLEGVVDIFLYGASIVRSARPVRGRGFYLISAGTYTSDSEAILRHPRWTKLVAGFKEANATLLLFVPASAPGVGALAKRATRAVVLGDPAGLREVDASFLAELDVSASLTPPAQAAGADAAPERLAAEPLREPQEESVPVLFDPEPGAPTTDEAETDDLRIPPEPARERTQRPRRAWWILVLLLVAVAVALAAYWIAANRGEAVATIEGAAPRPETAAGPPATPPETPAEAGVALPYSVQVVAFTSFSAAYEELEANRDQLEEVPFFIAPEADPADVVYYKIRAGLAPDTSAAMRLRERLVTAGAIRPEDLASGWDLIQHTPLAFHLGEFSTRAEAEDRAASLVDEQVSADVVRVPFSDGSDRWRLYGGAFSDSSSAEAMRAMLADAELPTRLVRRVGAPRDASG